MILSMEERQVAIYTSQTHTKATKAPLRAVINNCNIMFNLNPNCILECLVWHLTGSRDKECPQSLKAKNDRGPINSKKMETSALDTRD